MGLVSAALYQTDLLVTLLQTHELSKLKIPALFDTEFARQLASGQPLL